MQNTATHKTHHTRRTTQDAPHKTHHTRHTTQDTPHNPRPKTDNRQQTTHKHNPLSKYRERCWFTWKLRLLSNCDNAAVISNTCASWSSWKGPIIASHCSWAVQSESRITTCSVDCTIWYIISIRTNRTVWYWWFVAIPWKVKATHFMMTNLLHFELIYIKSCEPAQHVIDNVYNEVSKYRERCWFTWKIRLLSNGNNF